MKYKRMKLKIQVKKTNKNPLPKQTNTKIIHKMQRKKPQMAFKQNKTTTITKAICSTE